MLVDSSGFNLRWCGSTEHSVLEKMSGEAKRSYSIYVDFNTYSGSNTP